MELPALLAAMRAANPADLDQEFTVVRSQSIMLKSELGLTSEAGALNENIKKNRYRDILPYDQNRVVLSLPAAGSSSDYINASFIQVPAPEVQRPAGGAVTPGFGLKGAAVGGNVTPGFGLQGAVGGRRYIACQGPLSSTLTDFWRMVWEFDVKVIVMACREVELGKRKCERYWAAAHQSASFGPFTVSSQGETQPSDHLLLRALSVRYQQDSRSVTQFQFLSWPDHDVPSETAGVLDLLEEARRRQGAHSCPLLVHCSAGCGRTGVICALDYIHHLLVTKISEDFSVQRIVLELRKQRPSAVQTKDQYRFIFTATVSMLQRLLLASQPQVRKPVRRSTTAPGSSLSRQSSQVDMNDTYAVVSKPKQPPPASPDPAYPPVAKPRSSGGTRTLPPTGHYDNVSMGAPAAPVYSTVKPRAKIHSLPPSATPIYDLAEPANQSPRVGSDYTLVPADNAPADDDDYEDFSSSVSDVTSFCAAGGIGFNCRVQRPRGPRDPPAEWGRMER
ncbi:tyrosine-protein phosphatase non-receptor type 18 isoform 3-T3 [Menidia menidia]